jgi:hypothetical protein
VCSLASSLADEVTKTGIVPMRDLVQHVLGQLQVSLRAGQADVAHVGRERGQEGPRDLPAAGTRASAEGPQRSAANRGGVPIVRRPGELFERRRVPGERSCVVLIASTPVERAPGKRERLVHARRRGQ